MKTATVFVSLMFSLCCAVYGAPPFKKPVYERELFRAERFRPAPNADYGEFKLINTSIKVHGAVLKGWILKKEKPSGLIIYYYGNSESVHESRQKLFTLAHNTSSDILCLDYRSYGSSSGTPAIDFMLEDSLEIYDLYAPLYMDVFVYGHSLGTIPALHTAIERRVNGVILEASFTTAEEAVPGTDYYLPWPLNALLTLEASKELAERKPQQFERIKELNAPLLVLHGSEDALFPPEMGARMFRAAPAGDKKFVLIPGAGHHNMDISSGMAKENISGFISEHSGNPFSASITASEKNN
jgi:pimeloyl-ACP methyl ester carboxylesterase